MEIQADARAFERASERGTNEEEIKDVIQAGITIPSKYGRIGKATVVTLKTSSPPTGGED
jgi:hypothetical protein